MQAGSVSFGIPDCLQDVLDLLKEKRPEPVSKAEIKAAKGFDVSELPELLEQLQQHSNIEQTPSGGYVFKVILLTLVCPSSLCIF